MSVYSHSEASMEYQTSPETIEALQNLVELASSRGDETMAVLLSGVLLYARLGREYELLQVMRNFATEVGPAVENTPSAADLRKLYERES